MKGFPGAELSLDPQLSALERFYVRCLGAPMNGLRIRLRHVLPATRGAHGRILDAGCGPAVFAMEMAKRNSGVEVVGIDIDGRAVERARLITQAAGIPNCRFEVGDVTSLGFTGEFDLVLSVDNLEHIEDDVHALTNLAKALKPGGKLVIHVPGYFRRWLLIGRRVNFDVPGHVRPGYRPYELREKLKKAGLELVEQRATYGILETFTNNVSYLMTGAEKRNKHLYSIVFPFLLALSYLGKFSRPSWGAGLLAVARRPYSSACVEGRVDENPSDA